MVDTWVTVDEVLDITRKMVTDDDIVPAQNQIDLVAERLPADADRIGARDQHWLKRAVAYQAVWLRAQPDALERLDLTTTGQSSASGDDTWLVLAPYAKWALRNVSWLRSRSLRVRAPGEFADNRRVVYGDDEDPGEWRRI